MMHIIVYIYFYPNVWEARCNNIKGLLLITNPINTRSFRPKVRVHITLHTARDEKWLSSHRPWTTDTERMPCVFLAAIMLALLHARITEAVTLGAVGTCSRVYLYYIVAITSLRTFYAVKVRGVCAVMCVCTQNPPKSDPGCLSASSRGLMHSRARYIILERRGLPIQFLHNGDMRNGPTTGICDALPQKIRTANAHFGHI